MDPIFLPVFDYLIINYVWDFKIFLLITADNKQKMMEQRDREKSASSDRPGPWREGGGRSAEPEGDDWRGSRERDDRGPPRRDDRGPERRDDRRDDRGPRGGDYRGPRDGPRDEGSREGGAWKPSGGGGKYDLIHFNSSNSDFILGPLKQKSVDFPNGPIVKVS